MKYAKHIIFLLSIIGASVSVSAQFVTEKKIGEGEELENQQMHIVVSTADGVSISGADVLINGLNPRKPVMFKDLKDTLLPIENSRLYTVSCVKEGYAYYNEQFWPNQEEIHEQDVKLLPLAIGQKTVIWDIVFMGDKTYIYPKSKPSLDELLSFLKVNPEVKIQVIGHVNGPDNSHPKKFYQKSSVERAQAVVDYLIANGIESARLDADGRGNSEMLFLDPSTEWQSQANRRIEIVVTGL